ncbi:diguanylate cyclase [Zooshikella harenae]|uniref:diguanylate cyclase n=1 Tax=Zooshikella harenae TaxID=2827238 RepID=A0ABS5ZFY0_9GAMM|nr:diguanylate cyclase [Zooshikella harenae]MBU2712155.1 GGDEF domain-containing protein [Zooshikella harenae]
MKTAHNKVHDKLGSQYLRGCVQLHFDTDIESLFRHHYDATNRFVKLFTTNIVLLVVIYYLTQSITFPDSQLAGILLSALLVLSVILASAGILVHRLHFLSRVSLFIFNLLLLLTIPLFYKMTTSSSISQYFIFFFILLYTYIFSGLIWRDCIVISLTALTCVLSFNLERTIIFIQSDFFIFFLFSIIFCIGAGYYKEFQNRQFFLIEEMLSQQAETDPLTGISNRRTLNHHLVKLWKQACREKKNLALILVDIDYFKLFNDYYGHIAGDHALKRIATELTHHARRPLDLVARYGGEEFALLLYDIDANALSEHSNKIVTSIAALEIPHEASKITKKLTISCGSRLLYARPNLSVRKLLADADQALYSAKAHGRNQAVIFGLSYKENL